MFSPNSIQVVVFLNLICTTLSLDDGKINYERFCYEDKSCGPDSEDWGGLCKTGRQQSPIDLPAFPFYRHARRVYLDFNDQYCNDGKFDSKIKFSSDLKVQVDLFLFVILNDSTYTTNNSKTLFSLEFWIVDNGHTIQVTLESELTSSARMYGYEQSSPYIFAQIHFHWGNDSVGSEHSINKEFYPMEAHLVHYSSKYANFSAAVASGDPTALAVIAVFITEGYYWSGDSGLETIVANIPKLNATPTHIPERIDLSTFLPDEDAHFYRYLGSLTTPACNEVVQWTVVKHPIYVRPSLLNKFRRVKRSDHRRIGANFRPTQELGDRIVQYLAKK
ncbi:putative carbonic anhydrase 3 [Pseudolycoriella hygida]|uniref:Carbonic anhydrase n=1 Tax=Pseudolycoriella hygida TaxID=35572 RepID=A0A9Q0S9Z1_9DIPT|nr:putative carbonic anhydrase 3 [Pseudolycoriella hygida]